MDSMNQGSNMSGSSKDVEENKLWGALSYISIISIIVLLTKKDSEFAKFHAKQGVVLFIASILVGWLPFIGWFIISPIVLLLSLAGIIMAAQGKMWKMPLIGDIAAKLNM